MLVILMVVRTSMLHRIPEDLCEPRSSVGVFCSRPQRCLVLFFHHFYFQEELCFRTWRQKFIFAIACGTRSRALRGVYVCSHEGFSSGTPLEANKVPGRTTSLLLVQSWSSVSAMPQFTAVIIPCYELARSTECC